MSDLSARLQDCLVRAAYAAAEGNHVDCSSHEYALTEAEAALTRVLQWRGRVENEVEAYRATSERLETFLGYDLARGVGFLQSLIAALERYAAAGTPSAAAAATAAIAALVAQLTAGVASAVEGAAGTGAGRAFGGQTQPPLGPQVPAERKEGNIGGPERRG